MAKVSVKDQKIKERDQRTSIYHLNTVPQPFTKTVWVENILTTVHYGCK